MKYKEFLELSRNCRLFKTGSGPQSSQLVSQLVSQLHLCVSWSEYCDVTVRCNDIPTALTGLPTARCHTSSPCALQNVSWRHHPTLPEQIVTEVHKSQDNTLFHPHCKSSAYFQLDNTSVRLSVTLYQLLTVCWVVMKFGKGILQQNLSDQGQLSENLLSDSYTALWV